MLFDYKERQGRGRGERKRTRGEEVMLREERKLR